MNIITTSIAAIGLLIAATQAQATLIANGDFGTTGSCSLSGWQQFGDISTSDASGNCSAELNVNDFPDFEAELWQELTFNVNTDYTLSVDFTVETSLFDTVFDDYFSISLINEDFDILELFSLNIIGTESFSQSLVISAGDLSSFSNQNWSLSFYLFDDIDFDDNNSLVSINHVFFEEESNAVPEPSSLAIFALGFAGLMSRRKIANELVRKSIKSKDI